VPDPASFSIPYCIGDVKIESALYDLGASVSLVPLSLSKKLQLSDLKPTNITILFVDHSVRCPAGILEDIPVQLGRFVDPCDFVVIDMDDSLQAPIILGWPFLSTAGAIIEVVVGRISIQLCGEKIDFYLPSPKAVPTSAMPLSPACLEEVVNPLPSF